MSHVLVYHPGVLRRMENHARLSLRADETPEKYVCGLRMLTVGVM